MDMRGEIGGHLALTGAAWWLGRLPWLIIYLFGWLTGWTSATTELAFSRIACSKSAFAMSISLFGRHVDKTTDRHVDVLNLFGRLAGWLIFLGAEPYRVGVVKSDAGAENLWANGNVQLFQRLLCLLAFLAARRHRIEYGGEWL